MKNTKIEELANLQKRVKELKSELGPEVTQRMGQIVEEMNALAAEGIQLANNSGIEFNLSGLNFLPDNFRYSDISYRPDEGRVEDWESSSAYC